MPSDAAARRFKAALCGAVGSGLFAGTLAGLSLLVPAARRGLPLIPLLADFPQLLLTALVLLFVPAFALSLLLTLWLEGFAERGVGFASMAAVALPAGALIALALPLSVMAVLEGPDRAVEWLMLRPKGALEGIGFALGAGAGIGAGTLLGLRNPRS